VPASVQNPGSRFSQRSDCSISSSFLSRSVNSIIRGADLRRHDPCHGCAPLLKQRAALFAAHGVCVCLAVDAFEDAIRAQLTEVPTMPG
jgi:hypothetical protein